MSSLTYNHYLNKHHIMHLNCQFAPGVTFSWEAWKQWKDYDEGKKVKCLQDNITNSLMVKNCDGSFNPALKNQKGAFVGKRTIINAKTQLLCTGEHILESEYNKMGCPQEDYVFEMEFPDHKHPKKEKIIVIPHSHSKWQYMNDARTKKAGSKKNNNAKFFVEYINGTPLLFVEFNRKIRRGQQVCVDYGDKYWELDERWKLLSDT